MSPSIRSRLLLLALFALMPGLLVAAAVIAISGSTHTGPQAAPEVLAPTVLVRARSFEPLALHAQHVAREHGGSPRGELYLGATPVGPYNGLSQRAAVQLGLGSLVLAALAVLGAVLVARNIVGPLQRLKEAAVHLQAGESIPAVTTGISEFDEVARALAEASAALASSRAELEHEVTHAVARTRLAEQRVSQGQRLEALGRLTGGVAHDFNNLLGIISNSAHLIGKHPAATEFAEPLDATRRAVQTGHQLTQHLVRFAARGTGTPQVVVLSRHLPDVLELIRSMLGRRIELVVHVAPDTAPLFVDPTGLDLALINLAANAVEAMPDGGELRLTARNATAEDREDFAEPGGAAESRRVLITLRDSGAGMELDVAAHAFEPFFTTKPFGLSAGMGLSQVHGFCVQGGGAVRLASTPGLGTAVLMLLPAAPGGGAAMPGAEGRRETVSLAGARVLLVDDNEALAEVTARLLTEHGAEVSLAHDGGQALRLVATEPPFDAVLTDVVMPGGLDGLALAERLREQHPSLAVVLISGYVSTAPTSEFPVLCKPCAPEELLAVLSAAVASTARRRGLLASAKSAASR